MMTALKTALVIVLLLSGAFAFAPSPPEGGRNAAVAAHLRIVSPNEGQKLTEDYITVQYQITTSGASTLPTFNVSLDGGDPVQTSTMSHVFTGLAPGQHTVTAQMVDANSSPVDGTLAQVHFVVAPPQNASARDQFGAKQGPQISAMNQQSVAQTQGGSASQSASAQDGNLPSSGSALPLLSVIGFGVLVGGIASALKTR